MERRKIVQWCACTILVFGIRSMVLADGPHDLPDSVGDEASILTIKFYQQTHRRHGYGESRAIAEEMHSLGVASKDRRMQARGLIRMAYCEIIYGSWGNSWKENLEECERICEKKGTREHAELLMFRGYMAKWRPKTMPQAKPDLRAAIVIASQIEDDVLLSEAHNLLADLVLLDGETSICRSHALHALEVSRRCGYQLGIKKALNNLTLAFGLEHQDDLALPYAEQLLELAPENLLARDTVLREREPQTYAEEQRALLAALPKTGLSRRQKQSAAEACMSLARSLLPQGRTTEATEMLRQAAQYFKSVGNNTDYVDNLVESYQWSLENGVPIVDVDPFMEMIQTPNLRYMPTHLRQIVRILETTKQPVLAAKWREKLRLVEKQNVLTEHDRDAAAAKQLSELVSARRDLKKEMNAKQAATWFFRVTLVSACLLFGFSLLVFHLLANRKALYTLKQEVEVREAAQAKNEELAQQLLQTQKLDALGTLSAGIAHDFNNTLQAISMLTEVVKDESIDNQYLDTILEVTKQGSSLTRGMLVFSGRHETIKSSSDLITLVRETEKMVRHMVPATVSICSKAVCTTDSILVDMNESQIKQVLLNLVINAKDAMPDGGEVIIRISETEETPCRAQLIVSDNGVGMTEEVQARIFEPFFTTKDRGRGTGLGMSMAHGILEDHGGTIAIDSKRGQGTTVKILLPRVHEQKQSEEPSSYKLDANGEHVILAEDNEYVRLGIKTTLERLGFQVTETENGLDALEAYSNMTIEPDLILLDVDLPGLDGRDCRKALLEKGTTAPIILMTGLSTNHLVGAVLSKPFTEDDLAKAILSAQPKTVEQA